MTMRLINGDTWYPVSELREGDLVQLEGMAPSDLGLCAPGTCEDCDGTYTTIEYEFQRVDSLNIETPTCIVVNFDSMSFGFPPDFLLNVHERGPQPVAREHMQGAPEVEVDTPFGPVYLMATNADSIMVNCNSDGRFIIVNNAKVCFLHHWWRQSDGTWSDIAPSGAVGTRLAINRLWEMRDRRDRDASTACYRKVRETFPTVVREWAETPIGMHWLRHAQEAYINNRARIIEERIVKETDTLAASKAELATLLGKDVAEIEAALRG